MKAKALLFVLLAFSTCVSAQSGKSNSPLSAVMEIIKKPFSAPEGVVGSPLLFEDYQGGKIWLTTKPDAAVDADINFNLEKQLVVVKLSNGSQGTIALKHIKRFEANIGQQTWKFEITPDVTAGGAKTLKCYQVLHNSKYVFYKYAQKKVETFNGQQVLKMRANYFLKSPGKGFQQVELSQASVEKAMPQQVKQIRTFVKQQPSSIFNETVIVNLLRYLEQ